MSTAMSITELTPGSLPIMFDLVTSEGREDSADAPKHQAESGAFIGGAVVDGPTTYEMEGILTASPDAGVPGMQRTVDIRDRLIKLKEKRQPVILSGTSIFDVVLLTKVKAGVDAKTGKAIKISISAQAYREVKPGSATMPPARFKPAVKPGGVRKPDPNAGAKMIANDLADSSPAYDNLLGGP